MLCCAMSCYVMFCNVMVCYVTLYHAMLYSAMLCSPTPCFTTAPFVLHNVMVRYATPCRVTLSLATLCYVMLRYITQCYTLLCYVVPLLVLPQLPSCYMMLYVCNGLSSRGLVVCWLCVCYTGCSDVGSRLRVIMKCFRA